MGFSAGKPCCREQGGEGSGERRDRIQLGLLQRQRGSSTVSSDFHPRIDVGNITPHLSSLSMSRRTQGFLWSSTVQGRCPCPAGKGSYQSYT